MKFSFSLAFPYQHFCNFLISGVLWVVECVSKLARRFIIRESLGGQLVITLQCFGMWRGVDDKHRINKVGELERVSEQVLIVC